MTLSATDLALYALALFILFLTPGPVWLATMARAMSGGFRAAWPLAFGVAVGDVAELMGQDAFEFIGGQHPHNALCDGDGGMGGVAARGKSIGSGALHDVDGGHGDAGFLAQSLNHAMEFWSLGCGDGLGTIGR